MAVVHVGVYVVEGGAAGSKPIKGELVASEELASSGTTAPSAITCGTSRPPATMCWSVHNAGTGTLYAVCGTAPVALATGANMRVIGAGQTEVWRCEVASEKVAVIDQS